jgi:phage terminase small subunit
MDPREKARRLYLNGQNLKEIASELDIKYDTVRQWKQRDKWPTCATRKCHKKVSQKKECDSIENPEKQQALIQAPLNIQQQLFCEVYVHNFNATQAYIRVYDVDYQTANSAGSRLLVNVSIRAYIKYLKELRAQSLLVDEIDIVERYMQIAFADYTDYVEFGEKLKPVISGGTIVKDINPATGNVEPIMQRVNFVKLKDSSMVCAQK